MGRGDERESFGIGSTDDLDKNEIEENGDGRQRGEEAEEKWNVAAIPATMVPHLYWN